MPHCDYHQTDLLTFNPSFRVPDFEDGHLEICQLMREGKKKTTSSDEFLPGYWSFKDPGNSDPP